MQEAVVGAGEGRVGSGVVAEEEREAAGEERGHPEALLVEVVLLLSFSK